jgi:hypothetical protein
MQKTVSFRTNWFLIIMTLGLLVFATSGCNEAWAQEIAMLTPQHATQTVADVQSEDQPDLFDFWKGHERPDRFLTRLSALQSERSGAYNLFAPGDPVTDFDTYQTDFQYRCAGFTTRLFGTAPYEYSMDTLYYIWGPLKGEYPGAWEVYFPRIDMKSPGTHLSSWGRDEFIVSFAIGKRFW